MTNAASLPNRFAGQVAFITGAAMGIGRAVSERLAAEGARVGMLDVHPDVKETAHRITDAGGKALPVVGSVTSNEDVAAAVAATVDAYGGLDVLVSNAGVTRHGPDPPELDAMTDAEWDGVYEVNLKGTFRVCRAALPHLRGSDSGVVICLSSIIGSQQGWATRVHYAASKAGVEGFVRALAVEAARDGIRVVGIAPGLVESPQTLDSAGPEALRAFAAEHVPLGAIGQPDDLASIVAFCASGEARYLHGVIITADGGMGVRSVNPLPERGDDATGGP